MTTAFISLGFDVTHAVFTITTYRPLKVIVIIASVRNRIDPRSLVAYSSLEQVAGAVGAKVEKLEVEVTDVIKAVDQIKYVLEREARTNPLVIDIGGGLRLLIVEILLAYLSMSPQLRENTRLIAYLEGTSESREILPGHLRRIFLGERRRLSDIEKSILEVMEEGSEYSLDQIYRMLENKGLDISKQYVHKILQRLIRYGILIRTGRGRYLKILTEKYP